MFKLLLASLLVASASSGSLHKVPEEQLHESERILPFWAGVAATKLFKCYQSSCWTSTKDLMEGVNLWDKKMYRDFREKPITSPIEWTQFSRCWWGCKEDFVEVSYRENDGGGNNPIFKVFVANGLDIPYSFNTKGLDDTLNIALFHDDADVTEFDVMIFVIMPRDWKIYQNRFYTSSMRGWVKKIAKAGFAFAGKKAGMAVGSVIAPGAGTAVGGAVGKATANLVFAENYDDFFGQYVHHIG